MFRVKSIWDLIKHTLVILVLGTGLILFFFYIYLPSSTNHGETVTVPNLEGMTMDELNEYLDTQPLRYEINDSTYNPDLPPQVVITQFPHPGAKVKEDRKIYISVNRNTPPMTRLPSLEETSLKNAEAQLRSLQLKRGKIRWKPHPDLNIVLELWHDGKKLSGGDVVPKGAVIDIVIGDGVGNNRFPMPNLIGDPLTDARFEILGSNLRIGVVNYLADTALSTVVIRQRPSSGRIVRIGQEVDLWVAPRDSIPEEIEEVPQTQ